jgi:hypothetical protein
MAACRCSRAVPETFAAQFRYGNVLLPVQVIMKNVTFMKIAGALACATLVAPGTPVLHAQAGRPTTGTEVLERMHDKYAKKWYPTLTFTQKTTLRGSDGAMTEQTWYESLQWQPGGARLRIDVGNLADGNGSMSSADSTWMVRAGKLTRTDSTGNPFIPLIENVYLQPAAITLKQLEPLQFDMSRVVDVTWEGRSAWAVGATSASDTTSPQFWIDTDRLVLVRMLLRFAPTRPPFDIHLDNYVETGGGWLATKVSMFSGGVPRQTEEYSGWKTRVKLDSKLFDPATWTTAVHWATPR